MHRTTRSVVIVSSLLVAVASVPSHAANKEDRVEWFRDLGFGLFIHWSLDSQIGSVISHSLVGASEDYVKRFIEELPKTFNPKRYDPDNWAVLAKLAGAKYVVFTTKHHSGFCMYDTATTDFDIMNTPYGKDVTASLVKSLRKHGLAVGFYFSPDDFYFLHKQGTTIRRRGPDVAPKDNPDLMKYDLAQLRELLTNYGPIDVMFIDGPAERLRDLCWELQPNIVVTRGAMETPEQFVPGVPLKGAWETCMTMGTQWQFKPTNETYKSGTELINTLVETRAKGGNLLLNVGPEPDGELPFEQDRWLRELALWMFVNGEAIHGVRPWAVTNEGNVWFTKKTDEEIVYAVVTRTDWKWGKARTIDLRSVKIAEGSAVSVLGQTGEVLEYDPKAKPLTTWRQDDQGLHVTATRAQRLYNDRKWPNPVVLKITRAKPGLVPPKVVTGGAKWDHKARAATFSLIVKDLGGAASLEVGVQYRLLPDHTQPTAKADPWKDGGWRRCTATGPCETKVKDLLPDKQYEYRGAARHPLIAVHGESKRLSTPGR
ncbi:MAG: alpha-L-fucosidase [Phycisphaerae bacterium]|nr:alpha-L-fucosidase [Phycisphaerae bacterium]